MTKIFTWAACWMGAAFLFTCCGGPQGPGAQMQIRALEEAKALELIAKMLEDRSFKAVTDVKVELSTETSFECDFRVVDQKIAIEYVTTPDAAAMGTIPPAAEGSRLHVIPARAVSPDPGVPGEPLYVYIISAKDYEYQFNPKADQRADVTYFEVESRLRRDVTDFLTWYENSLKQEAK